MPTDARRTDREVSLKMECRRWFSIVERVEGEIRSYRVGPGP